MKNGFRSILISAIFLVLGYILGVVLHPRLVNYRVQNKEIDLSENGFLLDTLYDIQTGKTLRLTDTLSYRSRNLLVYWSPTCSYSKRFFQNQLNNQVVGVFCIPLTNDWEYMKYYVDAHQIPYPQLVVSSNEGIKPVDSPFITAVPTFIVVDSLGKPMASYVGINDMDELLNVLYN